MTARAARELPTISAYRAEEPSRRADIPGVRRGARMPSCASSRNAARQVVADRQARPHRIPRDGAHRTVEVRRTRRASGATRGGSRRYLAGCCRIPSAQDRAGSWATKTNPAVAPAAPQMAAEPMHPEPQSAAPASGDGGRGGPVAILGREEERRRACRRPLHEISRFVAVKVSSGARSDVIDASDERAAGRRRVPGAAGDDGASVRPDRSRRQHGHASTARSSGATSCRSARASRAINSPSLFDRAPPCR